MKKTYISPCCLCVKLHACNILNVSATGGVNTDSMVKEADEEMSRRNRSSFWDEDMD